MQPILHYIKQREPNKTQQKELCESLRAGELLIHPADTCYGIAGRFDHPTVAERISQSKGTRSAEKSFSVAVCDLQMAHQIAYITPIQEQFLRNHTPERLSFILPRKDGQGGISIRIPKLRWFRRLIQAVGSPLITTSANHTGKPPIYTEKELLEVFENNKLIAHIICGGTLPFHLPSTLVDLRQIPMTTLRQGGYTLQNIQHTPTRMCIFSRNRYPIAELVALTVKNNRLYIGKSDTGRHCYLYPGAEHITSRLQSPKNPLRHYLRYQPTAEEIQSILDACAKNR